ncbi:hypothetical protein Tco_0174386 [Tanacetum coccineum]
MAELLKHTLPEGYRDAIIIPAILADNFELKHGLLNLVTSKQFYGFKKEDPHAHIRWFNKITSNIKYKDVPNSSIKLMLFPFSIEGAARFGSKKNPLQRFDESFCEAWDRFKDLLRACPHHGFTELHQLDTFYNALTSTDQDSLNVAAGVLSENLLHNSECSTGWVIFDQASVKAVEEICVTCGGPHPYHQWFFLADDDRYSYNDAMLINRIDVIDVAYEEYAQEVLGFYDSSTSGNPTPLLDHILSTSSPSLIPFEGVGFILEEIEACLTNDSIPPEIDDADFDPKGDLLLLEKLLNDDHHLLSLRKNFMLRNLKS